MSTLRFVAASILLGAALLNGAHSPTSCLEVKAGPISADGDVNLTVTNRCGKAVTAYALAVRDPTDLRTYVANDNLVRLANEPSKPEDDILREGRSDNVRIAASSLPPLPTVEATAAFFEDRSAIGRPEDIEHIQRMRQRSLLQMEDKHGIVKKLSEADYAEVRGILAEQERLARERGADEFVLGLFGGLEDRIDRFDAAGWKALIDAKLRWYPKAIKLHREHLHLE